jgi:hypothetical protein
MIVGNPKLVDIIQNSVFGEYAHLVMYNYLREIPFQDGPGESPPPFSDLQPSKWGINYPSEDSCKLKTHVAAEGA